MTKERTKEGDWLISVIRPDHPIKDPGKVHLEAIYRNYDKLLRGLAPERSFNKPTLFIRGGRSNYIEDDDMPLIRQMFPQAEIATLPKAGHWVHVDAPEEFFQTVVNFLNRA